ncbi:TPA: tetratricopeptide repeat protein [Pseudomonas aeruginosa]
MIDLLEQSAFRGNMEALYKLAKIYQNGEGVPANPEIAVAYLTTASGLGHAESTRVLAWDYLLGKGVGKDIPYGTGLMEKAAVSSIRAKRELALLLNNTYQPGLNDPARAFTLLREAAAAGDAESAQALNQVLNKAKVSGSVASRSAFADKAGAPVRQMTDPSESRAETLKQRAMSGDVDAMYKLGLSYSLGKAPSVDPQFDAYCWYAVAANHGSEKARTEIEALAGVRTLSDRKHPGKLDQCIREMSEVADQG